MKRIIPNILLLLIILTCASCREELSQEIEIYHNDFETGDLTNLSGGAFISFNGSQVLGNFNNEGFDLTLNNMPDHNYIVISMDLYIHDSWDGNTNELNLPGNDHDSWVLEFDRGVPRKAAEDIFFETTFSNGPCISYWCLTQSYPNIYPFVNNPRTGSTSIRLPGLCYQQDEPTGTSLYRFEKSFHHTRSDAIISFYDRLLQSNVPNPKCDESWSLDNLRIRVLTVER